MIQITITENARKGRYGDYGGGTIENVVDFTSADAEELAYFLKGATLTVKTDDETSKKVHEIADSLETAANSNEDEEEEEEES